MKYISQLNGFWNWRRLNEISHAQCDLYFGILSCGNATGWKREFNVPNSTLMGMCQISESELIKQRNVLVQKGLIGYKNGKKGTAGMYSIVILYDDNIASNMDDNAASNMGSNLDSYVEDIPRVKNKSKNKSNKPPIPPKQNIFAEYAGDDAKLLSALSNFEQMRKSIKKPLTERAKELLLSELNKLTTDRSEKIAILEQSILRNWQGVFALKDKPSRNAGIPSYDDDGDFLGR